MPEPKRKPGRPRLVDAASEATLRQLFPELNTKMTLHNRYYAAHTVVVLGMTEEEYDERLYYLVNPEDGRSRQTIMAELGRIEDEDLMREVAMYICEHRIATGRAIDGIRVLRGVRKAAPNPDDDDDDGVPGWVVLFVAKRQL